MATTALTATDVALNVASADLPVTGGEAIVAANQMQVDFPQDKKLLLVLNNTFAGAKNITIKAGDSAFVASGQGDLVVAMAQDDVKYLVVTSDRFKQSDGKLYIEFEAGTTGFVIAIALP